MHYVLTGFTQALGIRVFNFEKIGQDQARTAYTVRADVAMSRRYDIRIQELPLLCRLLLERCDQADETRTFTFTEEQMSLHAKNIAAARHAHPFKKKSAEGDPAVVPSPG